MSWDLQKPFIENVQVQPEDIDELGHANNAVYVRWLERCAWQHSQSLGLGLPEYQDVNKAQRIMSSIDEDTLSNLPAVMQASNGTKVLVGPENVADELKDTSVVMTKFDIGDGMQGMIGVVGPTRMDYAKVTARLSYFAESLSKMFTKPEQMQLPSPAAESEEEA